MCDTGRDSSSRMQIFGIDNNSDMVKSYDSKTDTNTNSKQNSLKKSRKFESKIHIQDPITIDEENKKDEDTIKMDGESPQSIIEAMNVL